MKKRVPITVENKKTVERKKYFPAGQDSAEMGMKYREIMATASQIPGEIFQRIGKKRKSSVNSNTESYHPALRTFALTPLLGASLQVS